MNTIVFNKFANQVLFEEKANEVERNSRTYIEVMEEQHRELMMPDSPSSRSQRGLRHRRSGYDHLHNIRPVLNHYI